MLEREPQFAIGCGSVTRGSSCCSTKPTAPFAGTRLLPPSLHPAPRGLMVYFAIDFWTHTVLKARVKPRPTAHSDSNTFSPGLHLDLFLSIPRALTSTDKSRHAVLHSHLLRSSPGVPDLRGAARASNRTITAPELSPSHQPG